MQTNVYIKYVLLPVLQPTTDPSGTDVEKSPVFSSGDTLETKTPCVINADINATSASTSTIYSTNRPLKRSGRAFQM